MKHKLALVLSFAGLTTLHTFAGTIAPYINDDGTGEVGQAVNISNLKKNLGGGESFRGTNAPVSTSITIPRKTEVVVPPTGLAGGGSASKYFQIKAIEFSATIGTHRKYTYAGKSYEDFPMGETNGIRKRTRNWTDRWDDHKYNAKVSWSNGSFTGGNTTYSPGGFRLYATSGWARLQYANGAYAQIKINKTPDASGNYIRLYNSSSTVKVTHSASLRRICWATSLGTGCVSYNASFETIPERSTKRDANLSLCFIY